jgi:CRISPR-associated protein Csx1
LASSTLADLPKKNYKEVVNDAKERIEKYLKDPNYCIDASRVRIAILPGIGKFEDKVFKGTVNGYRPAAFLEILKCLKEFNPEILILDLSHGLNYMPVYTRLAIEDAVISYLVLNKADNISSTESSVSTHSMTTEKDPKLKLIVYNSEPVPARLRKDILADNITAINIVENISIRYNFAIQALYTKVASLGIKSSNFKIYFWRKTT